MSSKSKYIYCCSNENGQNLYDTDVVGELFRTRYKVKYVSDLNLKNRIRMQVYIHSENVEAT